MIGYHGWGEKNSLGLNPRNPLKEDHCFLIAKVQNGQVLAGGAGWMWLCDKALGCKVCSVVSAPERGHGGKRAGDAQEPD